MTRLAKNLFLLTILGLTGCASQSNSLVINPVYGMTLEVPFSASDRIRMDGDYGCGISLVGDSKIDGFVHVTKLPGDIPQGLSAIDNLIQETDKGSAPTERLDLGAQAAGYAVHIDDFSTIWVVTRDNPSSLVIISIRTRYFDSVINSLAF